MKLNKIMYNIIKKKITLKVNSDFQFFFFFYLQKKVVILFMMTKLHLVDAKKHMHMACAYFHNIQGIQESKKK